MTAPIANERRVRRLEDYWSMRRFWAEEEFGIDSPQERAMLERVTDYTVELEVLEAYILDAEAAR